jgi:hypothetical protein
MRRSLLLAAMMLFSVFTFGQAIGDPNLDQAPNALQQTTNPSKAAWTLQFEHPLNRTATAGVEADSNYIWVTVWSANKNFKYSKTGVLLDSNTITGSTYPTSGTSYLRDIAWDGTYFYGSNISATIYKMDFTTGTCLGTIACPAGTVVRFCAYDPTADNGLGGFWVGNWSDGAKLISRTGTLLNSIPAANLPGVSCYGAAYDTTTANGGPFLWLFSQTGNGNELIQVNVTTKLPTGLVYDITQDVTVPTGSIAGGAFISTNMVAGTTTLGGLVQGQKVFGYDLASTVPLAIDLALTDLDLPQYVQINTPVAIKGTIENQGSNTITSFNIKWQVNGGTVNTQSVTGQNLAYFATYLFTHSASWTPTATGVYNFKVWIDSPNGLTDDFTGNDTMTAVVTVVSQVLQRMPLLEAFTSSSCAPCVAGNQALKSVTTANPNKWILLKYQMSWPGNGDPYYTAEGGTRRTYYGISSVPALVIDAAPSFNTSSFTTAMLNDAYAVPAFVALTADFAQPGNGKTVNLNVNINPAADIPSTNLKLHAAIFEYLTTQNVATNGETSFEYVMKKMVPNANGTAIDPLTSSTPVTKTLTYTFNGNYRLPANALSPINHTTEHSVEAFSDLGVVVWLQDNVTKEVFQATYATKTAGIDQINDGNGIVALFPNPSNESAWLKYQLTNSTDVRVEVYDIMGQKVLSHNVGMQTAGVYDIGIPTSELASGTYMIKLYVGDRVMSDKLSVVR